MEKVLNLLSQKIKKKSFPNNACCIRVNTIWVKRPVVEIICSKQSNKKSCSSEILILRATLYQKCMKYSIKEVNQLLKNKQKIPKNKKKKVLNTLNELETFLKGQPKSLKKKKN